MLWQSEEEEEKKQSESQITPSSLPPPSWKHCVRALYVLIMINAGSATHIRTHTLKPRFWLGSAVGPCSGLWFCTGQLTLRLAC